MILKQREPYQYRLAKLQGTEMDRDAIPGTPFRVFECVPQTKPSRRKINNALDFDPYQHTLFDYPIIVKNTLRSDSNAIDNFNHYLTIHVPYCGMHCWHCFNPTKVCEAFPEVQQVGVDNVAWSAQDIIEKFQKCAGAPEGQRYNVLRVSGGEPFLVPELIAELLEKTDGQGRSPQLIWTETNLTSWAAGPNGKSVFDVACEEASPGLHVRDILTKHRDRLIIHPCFHGLTDANVVDITGTRGLTLGDLKDGFCRLHHLGLHLFPTFVCDVSDPQGLQEFFEFLYGLDKQLPLRVALIPVDFYGPVEERSRSLRDKRGPTYYGRHPALKRWNDLLMASYDLSYGQVPRPLASAGALQSTNAAKRIKPTNRYAPTLVLLKSVSRKEYRQEILSIVGLPPGTMFSSAYDKRHIEEGLAGYLGLCYAKAWEGELEVILAFADPESAANGGSYLPIRKARLTHIDATERIINFRGVLEGYLTPKDGKDAKDTLSRFSRAMTEYFGRTTLLSHATKKWVLLGEQGLWQEFYLHVGGNYDGGYRELLAMGWQKLVDHIDSDSRLAALKQMGVFLQIVPTGHFPAPREGRPAQEPVFELAEGDILSFKVRHYIADFAVYDEDPTRTAQRTLNIKSTCGSLTIDGYQPRALPKYGTFDFCLTCHELPSDRPAQVILHSAEDSAYFPRLQLDFKLKKGRCLRATKVAGSILLALGGAFLTGAFSIRALSLFFFSIGAVLVVVGLPIVRLMPDFSYEGTPLRTVTKPVYSLRRLATKACEYVRALDYRFKHRWNC